MNKTLLSVFTLFLPLAVLGQDTARVNALDPVTITATLKPMAGSKTGRNLIVIKGEDIAKYPVHSLDEVLRYIPGIEVQSRGPMGVQSDFVIRGGTFQQVLVVVDGLRVNDPNTGHFNSYIPIVPAEIERIEVLMGPSSAIYGSDAVGGVINVFTKTFSRNHPIGTTSQLNVSSGAYGLFNANGNVNYNTNKWTLSAGALSNNADGQQQRGIKGYFNLHTFSGAAAYKFNDNWRIAYRVSYDSRRFAAQNFYTSFATDTATERVNSLWSQLNLSYDKGNNHLTVRAGYKNVKDHYLYNSISTANNNTSKLWQGLATYQHDFSSILDLTTGLQYQRKSIASNDRGNHMLEQVAAFAVLNYELAKNLNISPAVRLDHDEAAGTQLVPQFNTSYRYGKINLRGSLGKTIRNADFTELYNNYNKPIVTSGRIGNPALTAEKSFSYEAGADFFAGSELKLAATYFQRRHTDLIDWTTTPYANMPRKDNLSPTGTYALARNITKVNTTGIEANVMWKHAVGNKQFINATAGFVWLNSVTSDGVPSFYTSSHAKYLTNAMLRYDADKWNLSINGLYKVRTAQSVAALNGAVDKSYFVANVKGTFNIIRNRLSVFAEADNVFDKKYADLLGAQMPGRWLMGGLSLQIQQITPIKKH
ncbi:TonB-dependent receptor [Mucilaginibacter pallidiroseus]|uniref:TonB-dependent receptor n=1 Tax=Mucilaginibacter pallidiroseus TaxID=2599295 RepID=A0A563UJE1_9SPHI|nr:TonB-dependent receptor [Mucilaginibacter pallidiroseus]TWR31429.1 TonB-dependent receptor [Mucilaginibacter pallidiroseus]